MGPEGGEVVDTRDAAVVTDEERLPITAREHSEVILVDVPLDWEPVGVWAAVR